MRSSERAAWPTCAEFGSSVCLSLVLVACTAPGLPLSTSPAATLPPWPTCAEAKAGADAAASAPLLALQRSVENGPLYAIARSASPVADCRAEQGSGAITLQYDFVDGARVRATRDPRIEYSEQVARLVTPPAGSAIESLKRAEKAAFGGDGCGIDWSRTPARTVPAETGATDIVFSGELCNCQGRIRRDVRGRIVELAFKSAC
jgi:hypothetical protein